MCLFGQPEGLKVTDPDGTNLNVELARGIVGGQIDASQIINYPSDSSLKAWVKAQLRENGVGFTFDDDFSN